MTPTTTQRRGSAESSATSVKSAARTLELLEMLAARSGAPARLTDLAEQLEAPRSSVHALLRTLGASGWVRTDPTGTLYSLGLRPLLVGTSMLDTDPYLRVARPILGALRDQLKETVHLARMDGDHVVYLITQESGREPRRLSRVGRWLPAHATSLGKALLAARDALPTEPMTALTEHTLTTSEGLAADLEVTRARGYAIDDEENTLGLRCIGVALRYTEPVQDAISCSVPLDRMTPEHQAEIVEGLLRARTQIEDVAPVQGTL